MIDYNFTEANKRSSSGLYVARLFRIPDADDGSIRMSIEISKYHGGYVIFKLPDKYWLGTSEQLDWDARQDILFWTCNDKKRAFIYDVTFDTYIGADTKLKEKDRLGWDEEQKCWIRHDFLYTIKAPEEDEDYAIPTGQKPGDYYGKSVLLKLPYSDSTEPPYKFVPTNSDRFLLMLKQAKKTQAVEPTMWEMSLIDTRNNTWVVKIFPFHVRSNSIREGNGMMQCYGYDLSHRAFCIFRFDLDDIIEKKKVEVFVHNFDPVTPERVVWDGEGNTWRAVCNGEIVYPRPFYFDNMYTENLPIDGTRLSVEILKLLPQNDHVKRHVAEDNETHKQRIREEYEKNNTSLNQIYRRHLWQSLNKKHLIWGIILVVFLLILIFALVLCL